MPPKKNSNVGRSDGDDAAVAVHQLEDIVANILGWLCVKEIMRSRRVCKKWKEAVRKTIAPLGEFVFPVKTDFGDYSMTNYNAMGVMTEAMPNLQQITIGHLGGYEDKYSDGEDPYEREATRTANYRTYDIEIISNFNKLRILEIGYNAELNGRYSVFFNSFPLLQKLTVGYCPYLNWDLDMLAGLPMLKELTCWTNIGLDGNINSLRVLKDTLEKVQLFNCHHIEGNFMDLADFPHLKELYLGDTTTVTGDIRDIGENDFPSLKQLTLPKGVCGGTGCEFQRISEATDVVRAIYLLKKQRPGLFDVDDWYWEWGGKLSEDSPDWYESVGDGENDDVAPPFYIYVVQAGPRIGYRWACEQNCLACEVNWLDPEPDRESSDYAKYIEELEEIQMGVTTYRGRNVELYDGFHQPPTEEEYNRLFSELDESYGLID